MKIVFTGGGTGGHVNPALNIAKAVRKENPHAEISFVGTKRGIESTLVPKAGYEIDFVEVQGFRRKLSFTGIKENCNSKQCFSHKAAFRHFYICTQRFHQLDTNGLI